MTHCMTLRMNLHAVIDAWSRSIRWRLHGRTYAREWTRLPYGCGWGEA